MICTNRDIILLNKRLDRVSRSEVYFPTQISGVSIYDKLQSSSDGGFHSANETYKIRIPLIAKVQNGKIYLPETHYDALTEEEAAAHWTIHTEDLIIVSATGFENFNSSAIETAAVTMQQAEEIADSVGFQKELIRIVEYSDNTLRGITALKHWRIGGV